MLRSLRVGYANQVCLFSSLGGVYANQLNVAAAFLLVCFSSLKKSTCESRKNVFYFTSEARSFSKKSNFRILDIQVLCCHQMPKHKTRIYFTEYLVK